ncbi:Uncharacterised protein [Bordetella pertussis]|nr:Uncharacterised protein [Bordetella pertussis]CFP56543.1 Uncharacterised protein [Bordetella pertussis]CFU08891.1 Uncharacterised protein [Bordetella pertussis]CPJ10005.1 Uncharacterised protein [Bordetella pertussis]CPK03870.1 Uncharacterised protein [Bordetella pertussis]
MVQPLAQAHPPQHRLRRLARRLAGQLQRQHDVFQRREVGQQLERLEYEAHMAGAQARPAILVEGEKILAGQVHAAR